MRRHRTILILLPTLLTVAWGGCSSGATEISLPATDPDIRGIITRADRTEGTFHMMVEADPSDSVMSATSKGSAKSRVRVTDAAQLLKRDGDKLSPITRDDLRQGATVSVWFDGPVLQSYPSQSGAKIVVMEEE